jgi:hypothetical protein
MHVDKCPTSCPCWQQGKLQEPVSDAEVDLWHKLESCAMHGPVTRMRQLVKAAAKHVARGTMDQRRVAILLSAPLTVTNLHASHMTVLAMLTLPCRKREGFKFPHGVPELIRLGVCMKTAYFNPRWWWEGPLSPLVLVLRDIMSLRKPGSRKKWLHHGTHHVLHLLLQVFRHIPVHVLTAIMRLSCTDKEWLLRHQYHWIPHEQDVTRLVAMTLRWERRRARRVWIAGNDKDF